MTSDATAWIKVAEDVMARAKEAPADHAYSLRALVEEALPIIREYRLLRDRFNEETASQWRRKQIMAKSNAKRKYGWS